jgi:Na+/H+-translocating membrane pyrophosphatase
LGLWSGLVIGIWTEIFTSHQYAPTRELARCNLFDAATNVIKGLALGYFSNLVPILVLALTVLCSFRWAAIYGIAIAAISMLSCLPIYLTIDTFGTISNGAFTLAKIGNLNHEVLREAESLSEAGITTGVVGKAYANA